jgi:hypothetical protein
VAIRQLGWQKNGGRKNRKVGLSYFSAPIFLPEQIESLNTNQGAYNDLKRHVICDDQDPFFRISRTFFDRLSIR